MGIIKIVMCSMLAFASMVAFADDLAGRFRAPSADARPQVWWHWMNGNVTKEGIYKSIYVSLSAFS